MPAAGSMVSLFYVRKVRISNANGRRARDSRK
jgi:hypothetical protein